MKSATDIQALGDQGIIIRSTDGCETWKYVENGYILYGVDFLDENFGIAVGNRGYIIKTTDGGTTWKDIMTIQSTINLYDVKVFDTQTYYICGGTGLLYITEDGGETFTKRPLPVVSGNSKTLHFFNRNEGYCAGEMGYIYYTIWMLAKRGLPNSTSVHPVITSKMFSSSTIPQDLLSANAGNSSKLPTE